MRGTKRIAFCILLGLVLAAAAADGPPAEIAPPQPAPAPSPAAPPENPFAASPGATSDADPPPKPKLFRGRLRQRLKDLFHFNIVPH
jgi:hypothetical protein